MAPTSSFSLIGDTTACIGPVYTYTAINVFNDSVTYNWSLPQGGGTLTYTDSIASVVWNENANRKIQLFLSNQYGVSKTKQLNTIINGVSPTQTPIAFNFARTLSTNSLPHGGGTQWFKNECGCPTTNNLLPACGKHNNVANSQGCIASYNQLRTSRLLPENKRTRQH